MKMSEEGKDLIGYIVKTADGRELQIPPADDIESAANARIIAVERYGHGTKLYLYRVTFEYAGDIIVEPICWICDTDLDKDDEKELKDGCHNYCMEAGE